MTSIQRILYINEDWREREREGWIKVLKRKGHEFKAGRYDLRRRKGRPNGAVKLYSPTRTREGGTGEGRRSPLPLSFLFAPFAGKSRQL